MTTSFAIVEGSHWHTGIHVDAFTAAGCRLVGLSDRFEEGRQRLDADFDCPVFTEPAELIGAVEPDLVIVLGRHVEMPALALEVASLGVPFVLEKPCAVSADTLRPVVEVVAERGLFAAVPLVNRYRDVWSRHPIEQPVFGHFRIVTGSADRYPEWGVPWVLDPAVSGGGALRNIGIHPVDAFLSVAGDAPVEVIGASIRDHPDHPGIDVRSVALLAAGPATGVIEAAYTFPDDGAADVEWRIETPGRYTRDRTASYEAADAAGVARQDRVEHPSRYQRFALDVCRRLGRREPPKVSVSDAHRAAQVVDAIYRKGRRHGGEAS